MHKKGRNGAEQKQLPFLTWSETILLSLPGLGAARQANNTCFNAQDSLEMSAHFNGLVSRAPWSPPNKVIVSMAQHSTSVPSCHRYLRYIQ
eukprot:1149469-Pelagomonas_calceolata.AAC.7